MKHPHDYSMKRLFTILVLLVLLTACSDLGGIGSSSSSNEDYRKGNSALVLSFMASSPPSELFDEDQLYIGIEAKNLGAQDIAGTFYFSGFDTQIFSGPPSSQIGFSNKPHAFKLEGKSFYSPEGGYNVFSFAENINNLKVTSYNPTILVTACYSYSTLATTEICLDPDPYSTAQNKACRSNDVSLSGGQGGPIEVTSVDVDPSKNSARFTFHIRNGGGGIVYDPAKVENCNPSHPQGIRPEDINKIHIDSVTIGGMGNSITSSCKPSGQELRLVDGKAVYMCSVQNIPEGTGAYMAPLSIEMSYGYRSSVSRSVKIIQTPGRD